MFISKNIVYFIYNKLIIGKWEEVNQGGEQEWGREPPGGRGGQHERRDEQPEERDGRHGLRGGRHERRDGRPEEQGEQHASTEICQGRGHLNVYLS